MEFLKVLKAGVVYFAFVFGAVSETVYYMMLGLFAIVPLFMERK